VSLIYRAIWQDDRSDLAACATNAFREWATEKHGEDLEFGPVLTTVGDVSSSLRSATVGGVHATEATLVEENGTDRWMTRQRVIVDPAGEQWIWVDVERTTSEVFRRQDIAAPRLVSEHLEAGVVAGGRPRVGGVLLRPQAYAVNADRVGIELVDPLRDPARSIPIVVFSHDERLEPAETMRRATTTQRILAGVAHVVALTPSAQRAFTDLVGHDLSVWGGAVRVYLPGSMEPWRHRYHLRDIVEKHPREVGRRIATTLSAAIAARKPPYVFDLVQAQLRAGAGGTPDELLEVAELEIADRDRQIQELRADVEYRDGSLFDRAIDIEELNNELEDERRKVRYWRSQALAGNEPETAEVQVPDQVTTLKEAAAFCQQYLSLVSLPDEAIRDLDELDAAPEATAWARTSWRGFRALAAYASEAADTKGGFWEWCQHSSHTDTWPATTKKLSMTESDTVLNNLAQRAARQLPVDTAVDSSGVIEMLAHLKVAEGGGSNIPRIYFYDDTKGSTKKVHVGFFGPHRYMENSKS